MLYKKNRFCENCLHCWGRLEDLQQVVTENWNTLLCKGAAETQQEVKEVKPKFLVLVQLGGCRSTQAGLAVETTSVTVSGVCFQTVNSVHLGPLSASGRSLSRHWENKIWRQLCGVTSSQPLLLTGLEQSLEGNESSSPFL